VSDRDYLNLYPISIWIPVHKKELHDVKVPIANIQKKYPFEYFVCDGYRRWRCLCFPEQPKGGGPPCACNRSLDEKRVGGYSKLTKVGKFPGLPGI